MKCEVFPGDRKCRHCLRRNVDCVMTKRARLESSDDFGPRAGQADRIDAYE